MGAQKRSNNNTIRNFGSRKIVPCEPFDFIKHGSVLKDKNIDSIL